MTAKPSRRAKPRDKSRRSGRSPAGEPAGRVGAFFRKPAVWIVGIIIAAAATALGNWLVPQFQHVISRLTETGDPVTVKVLQDEINRSVVLPAGKPPTGPVLAELGSLPPEDQLDRLLGQGAEQDSPEVLSLVLTGNRTEPVRITNVKPVADCYSPAARTRVNLTASSGNVDTSATMGFDLDKEPAEATYQDGAAPSPYFPARTISLAKDEQMVVIAVVSSTRRHCHFEFAMTVLAGDREQTQRINNGGRPFVRIASDPGAYEHVYWGGEACRTYTEHKGRWDELICSGG